LVDADVDAATDVVVEIDVDSIEVIVEIDVDATEVVVEIDVDGATDVEVDATEVVVEIDVDVCIGIGGKFNSALKYCSDGVPFGLAPLLLR
jgi:hypothetical protein